MATVSSAERPLEEEAVTEAIRATVEGVGTRVISAEHLVAIAPRTGRSKDHIGIVHFVEQPRCEKWKSLLERHGLTSKWKPFEKKYLERTHE